MTAAAHSMSTALPTLTTLPKKPLPVGKPRGWYEAHNRRIKAMRLAIALSHAGVRREQANNRRIRATAARIGVRPPSRTTCGLVRTLLDLPAGSH